MNTNDREKLRRRMGEAAALAPDDPLRREVEDEIARQGDWAQKEWLELLGLDECLRIELRRSPEAVGLEERLLAVPDETSLPRHRLIRWGMAAAAVLLLVCGGLAVLLLSDRDPAQQIRQIGLTAIEDHMAGQRLTVKTSETATLVTALRPQIHFDLKLPRLGEGFRLLGGRKCVIRKQTVLYTRWEKGGYEYSLYQFCPKDFGLPNDFSRRTVVTEGARAEDACDALVWTEKGCAYVLVAHRNAFVPSLTKSAGTEHYLGTRQRNVLVFDGKALRT